MIQKDLLGAMTISGHRLACKFACLLRRGPLFGSQPLRVSSLNRMPEVFLEPGCKHPVQIRWQSLGQNMSNKPHSSPSWNSITGTHQSSSRSIKVARFKSGSRATVKRGRFIKGTTQPKNLKPPQQNRAGLCRGRKRHVREQVRSEV